MPVLQEQKPVIKKAGQARKMAHTGAVTLIHWVHPCTQPFGQPAAMVIGNPANRSTVWIGAEKISGSDF